MTMNESEYPPGWDDARVRKVIEYYDSQTDEEAIADDEAAYTNDSTTMMAVPKELVPAVRELIFRYSKEPHQTPA